MSQSVLLKQLRAQWITAEAFRPYGQLITPAQNGRTDAENAQLNLQNGTPRFYIMRLTKRGRRFHQITRHVRCTQCLGSLGGKEWLIAVAPPSQTEPAIEKIAAFRIPGSCFIKLDVGTWHAGPYFDHDTVDFYNLELSDTNEVDHFTHDLRSDHLEFELI